MPKIWTKEYGYWTISQFVGTSPSLVQDDIVNALEKILPKVKDGEEYPEGLIRVTLEFVPKEKKDE
jgi:hypothetical protein